MREMKFRGKRLDNGEWLISDSVYQQGGVMYLFDSKSPHADTHFGHCWIDVDSATVGQFTGLKDKNGTEIYEGDIVKFRTTRYHTKKQAERREAKSKWFVTDVIFHEGGFFIYEQTRKPKSHDDYDTLLCAFTLDLTTGERWGSDNDPLTQVIGNIHDNPELLTAKK